MTQPVDKNSKKYNMVRDSPFDKFMPSHIHFCFVKYELKCIGWEGHLYNYVHPSSTLHFKPSICKSDVFHIWKMFKEIGYLRIKIKMM